METIHRKSAMTETAGLILAAHDRGEGLFWERYERQLPLCAFTSNGLNCRKCFQGPCRINPFGDEPSLGVCGADREQIVMENLFQATLQGVLDTARSVSAMTGDGLADFPDPAEDLPAETTERLRDQGILPVRKRDLFGVKNAFFSHKGYLTRTLKDLLRLGLAHYGFLKEASALKKGTPQGAASHAGGANLVVVGQPSARLMEQLQGKTKDKHVNVFLTSGEGLGRFQAPVDHGSAELMMAMNPSALLLLPGADAPGLETLARRWDLPVLIADGKEEGDLAAQAIKEALGHAGREPLTSVAIRPAGDRGLWEKEESLQAGLRNGTLAGLLILFGEPSVKQSFLERTLVLMEEGLKGRCLVLLGGDLGAQASLLEGELRKRAPRAWSDAESTLASLSLRPVFSLGSLTDLPRTVGLLRGMGKTGPLSSLPAVIAFPEFYRPSTWAAAVSLLSLGAAVQIGAPLPVWGSPSLTEALLRDWPALSGGVLLASPGSCAPRVQAEEILARMKKQA